MRLSQRTFVIGLALALLAAVPVGATVTLAPASAPVGQTGNPYSLSITISTDGIADTAIAAVTIVNGKNAADTDALAANVGVTSAGNAGIPPGLTLTWNGAGLVTVGGTVNANAIGTYLLTVTATGNSGGTGTVSYTFNITPLCRITFADLGPPIGNTAVPAADPSVPNNAQNFVMQRLFVQVDGTDVNLLPEPVKVNSLTYSVFGTGNDAGDISSVRLYADIGGGAANNAVDSGDLLLATASIGGNDGGFGLTGAPLRTIPGQTTEQWLVVYNFSGTAAASTNFVMALAPGANSGNCTGLFSGVNFSANIEKPTGLSAILQSNTMTIQSPAALDDIVVTSTGANVSNAPAGVAATALGPIEVLSFNLTTVGQGNAGTITISQMTFSALGSGDDSTAITGVRLFLDTGVVGTFDGDAQIPAVSGGLTFSQNNGTAVFSGLAETFLAAGQSKNYLVVYDMSATGPSSPVDFQLTLAAPASIQGSSTSPAAGSPISVSLVPFGGGLKTESAGAGGGVPSSLTISAGSANPAAENILKGTTDVPMLQLKMDAVSGTDVKVTSMVFRAQGTGDDKIDVTTVKLYLDRDADGLVDTFDTSLGTGTYNVDNGTVTISSLTQVIPGGSTQNWLVTYSFGSSVPDTLNLTYLTLFQSSTDVTLVNANTSAALTASVTGAPISGGAKTVVATLSTASIMLTIAKGAESPSSSTISGTTSDMPMLQLSLAADVTVDVKVTSLKILASGSGNDETDLAGVTLYQDRDDDGIVDASSDLEIGTGSFSVDNGTVTFSSIDWIIAKGTTQNWLITYDYAAPSVTPALTFAATIEAASSVTAENASTAASIGVGVTSSPVTGGTMTVGTVATVGGTPGGASGTSATGDGGRAASSVVGGGGPVERGSSGGGCFASSVSTAQPVVATLFVILAGMLAGMLWSARREREGRRSVRVRAG